MKPHLAKSAATSPDTPSAPWCPLQPSLFLPRILVVDDEPRLRNSLRDLLHVSGYDVTCAGTGREAMAFLSRDEFDLVVLDINMPEVSGQDVLEFISQKDISAAVIMLSGDSTFDQATQALRKGAEDFLTKPHSPEKLLESIARILQKRQRKKDYFTIQKRLQGSEELHRFIVNNSPDLIFMLDEQGCFSFVNERVESFLGCGVDELLGRPFAEILFVEDQEKAEYLLDPHHHEKRLSPAVELRLRPCNCDLPRHVEMWTTPVGLNAQGGYAAESCGSGTTVGLYGVARDISDRKQSEELRRYHLCHDLLTSLPNRALFSDRLQNAIGQAKRLKRKLAVMFLDIDRFKLINDTLGHLAGDELLQMVALRLKNCLREGDTLARIGGDEFTLLLPNLLHVEDAAVIARKILQVFAQPFGHHDKELRVTFSIGVAVFPDHGDSKEALLRNADLAMYRIKGTGRNGFQFYSTELFPTHSNHLDIESSLHKAIEKNELRLYYQPQVHMATGEVVGIEALIRWQHPQRGLLKPADFIHIAEETKLICDIGDWVLEQACRDAVALRSAGFGHIRVAINISPQQLDMDGFEQAVLNKVREHALEASVLEVEITENSLMHDMNKSMRALTALSREGVTITVDDFGTGYSSLSYLQTLPLHTIKIDRSFVKNIANTGMKNTIVSAILTIAKGLNINFVAEGVESQFQHECLLSAGCPVAQGYYYARPLELPKLIEYLSVKY